MIRPLLFFLLMLLLILSGRVEARIYKWVNENGETIYSEKRPVNIDKDNVKIINIHGISEERATAANNAAEEQRKENEKRQEKLDEENKIAEQSAQKAKQEREQREYCQKLRDRLTLLKSKSRVKITHESGKKEVLRKNARTEEIRNAQNNINKHCR